MYDNNNIRILLEEFHSENPDRMYVRDAIVHIMTVFHVTLMDIIHMQITIIYGVDNYEMIVNSMCNSFRKN